MATLATTNPQLANALPPQLLQLGKAFSLAIPPNTFIEPGGPAQISASLGDGSPLPAWLVPVQGS